MAAAVAIGASALLYALAFPPFDLRVASWVALVPLFFVWERTPPGRALLLGLAHGTLIALTTTPWLVPTLGDYFGLPRPAAVGLLALFGLATLGVYHGGAFALLAFTRPRLARGVWLALVPAAWVAIELARTSLGLRCGWEKLGDAHWQSERIRQLASLTGVYGISALVAFGNVVGAEALRSVRALGGPDAGPARRSALVSGGLLACALVATGLYGEARLAALRTRSAPSSLDVRVIQGHVEPSSRWRRADAPRVLNRYARLTRESLRSGPRPDLIVWPEQAVQTSLDDPVYGPALHRLLDRFAAPVLLGAPRLERSEAGHRVYNSAFLVRPGHPPLVYDKRRLVPFSETHPLGSRFDEARGDLDPGAYSAGHAPGVFAWEGPTLGVLICFEAIYPDLARALAQGGARVLVNLSNDAWFLGRGGQEQHLSQAVLRAVETGLPLVRATTTGISASIAPDGTILERLPHPRSGTLRIRLTPGSGAPTFYTRIGDAFAYAALAILSLAVLAAARPSAGAARGREPEAPRAGAASRTPVPGR